MSKSNSNTAAVSQSSAQSDFSAAQPANDQGFQYKADMKMGNVATKTEHDHLVENRPTPELEVHLTPDGIEETIVKQQVNLKNERRIQQLQNSLNNAHDRLQNDHGIANMRGRAKQDFDHSR